MSITSQIDPAEYVGNRDRKFGAENIYYPAYVRTPRGWRPALFTANQMQEAMARAEKNAEDVPPRRVSLFGRLFGL